MWTMLSVGGKTGGIHCASSDGPDSMTSGSDVVEAQVCGPPDDDYPIVAQSGLLYENDSLKEAWSPSRKLEDAVAQLQRDIADYRKELRFGGGQGPTNPPRPTKRSGFTLKTVPRYSGKSSWEQYWQVFAAIACSNGWDDVAAALHSLQLLFHLDGDALNVALLIPESQRVVPGVLMNSLPEHYGSPGQLAEYKRQFRMAFRRPDDDPSIFAIEVETLAQRVFADVDSSIQLQMVRIGSLMDRPTVHYADTSIVSDLILRCGTLWTAVMCGKVITRPRFVVTMAQTRILHGQFTR